MAFQTSLTPGFGYGNPYIDSLVWGCQWTESPTSFGPGTIGNPIDITYSFGSGLTVGGNGSFVGASWLTSELSAFNFALQLYENICNINFVNTSYTATYANQSNIVFYLTPNSYWGGGGVLGEFEVPDGTYTSNYGYFNYQYSSWDNLNQGSYGFIIIIHELGHGLGLAHPHDGGSEPGATVFPGVTSSSSTGAYYLNQGIFTTMSYVDGWSAQPATAGSYGWQGTPKAFDIAALQAIYGANTSYQTGSNVYSLPSSNGAGTFWSCIWDAGGIDTISNSGSSIACVIDLNAAPLTGPNAGGFVSHAIGIIGGLTIANGVVIENAVGGSGNDTLVANNTTGSELDGGAGADTLTGGTAADVLYGGDGNDTVNAGAGNDLIIGGDGAGDDTYNGGDGIDTVKYTSATAAITVNLSTATGTATSTAGGDDASIGNDTLTGIENIIAGNFNDTLIGSAANNAFTGESGNDTLVGNAGNDTLTGNAGNDILNGGVGVDTMDGGEGSDIYLVGLVAEYATGEVIADTGPTGTDELRFATTAASTLTLANTAVGIENIVIGTGTASSAVTTGTTANNINASAVTNALSITGNNGKNSLIGTSYDDTLTGNAGDDILNGGGGADALIGDIGNDTYVIDNIGDAITEGAGAGTDLVRSSISYILGSNLENLTLMGSANINGTGNTTANTITGNTGNNILDGGDGVDALVGGAGNDTYIVDVISASGLLQDTMTEASNAGTDTIQLRGTYSGVVKAITLAANFENLDISNTGSSLYNLIGNTVNNTLIGNDANNSITGGKGADILTGGSGKDTFIFTAGDSGQTAITLDKITDYTKGVVGTGDLIDYVSNLTVGGSAASASATQASIDTKGLATFAAGSGTTLSDALLDIATRMTAATNTKGEFALFQVNNTGDYYAFISDGTAGVGANDVLIQLIGMNLYTGIDLTGGNLTII